MEKGVGDKLREQTEGISINTRDGENSRRRKTRVPGDEKICREPGKIRGQTANNGDPKPT